MRRCSGRFASRCSSSRKSFRCMRSGERGLRRKFGRRLQLTPHESMKVALITGAAQGIGARIAEVLAERGFSLALNDLRSPSTTTGAVRQRGADAIEVLGSVADESAVAAMSDTLT